jgi:hypothetical protein
LKRKLVVLTALAALSGVAGQTTAQAERDGFQISTLHRQARFHALHGGIQGSCYGCATYRMKWLSRRLIIERFSTAGSDAVRWSLCVVRRESGFNPGAVNSSSGASGLFQFLGHPQYSHWMLTHDPVGQVQAAWELSHRGRDRSPWYGGGYSC